MAAKKGAKKVEKAKETIFISEDDRYLFGQGTHYDIYKKLGAHPSVQGGKKGYYFAVWAPNALSVHVVGSWNGWNEAEGEMKKLGPVGIWSVFIEGVVPGQMYKFLIYAKQAVSQYELIEDRYIEKDKNRKQRRPKS